MKAESPKGIASLSSEAAGLLQSFITSFAGSVSHKSLPQARYRLAPMLSILPAFSSPELKAFPVHLRHIRSFGSTPSLPTLPWAARLVRFASQRRVCVIYSALLHKSHRLAEQCCFHCFIPIDNKTHFIGEPGTIYQQIDLFTSLDFPLRILIQILVKPSVQLAFTNATKL